MDALQQYISLYRDNARAVDDNAPEVLNRPRPVAFKALMGLELPKLGAESYDVTSLPDMLAPDFGVNINRVPFSADAAEAFKCGLPNISTLLAFVVNDAFRPTQSLLRNLPEGVTVTSLAAAARENPELVDKSYNALAGRHFDDPVVALNTLFAQDGVFIRIARGVALEKPLQIVSLLNASTPMLAPRRLLICLEEGAKASVLCCDHTAAGAASSLNCQVTEIFLGKGARLDLCELEESSVSTGRLCKTFATLDDGAELVADGVTLMCGHTRNEYDIDMPGNHARCRLGGIAIASGAQTVDSRTTVRHHSPKGESNQMYKYILDDSSKGSFYGSIVVDEEAKFTNAYQNNRNVLASKEARMHTRPQLEIYCDEVKCSHGATVGQLDANALFYMRTRGIPEPQAKMMLMQAFMADVIDSIPIPALQSRLRQLVESRLAGSHDLCSACQDDKQKDI
ncbi:MAG: Fe-S cluster assembly protein SufD [Clostridium sp.]|nr:Fe-S cluster assembly protein SufD [Clostridium sp.]